MTTVHANSPRDALSRLETMVLMAGYDLPVRAIREQIQAGLQVVLHLDRLPDGRRVVTSVAEIQGIEGDTILMQEVFSYRSLAPAGPGQASGELVATGLRPKFLDKLAEAGIDVPAAALAGPSSNGRLTRAGAAARAAQERVAASR